VYHLFLFGIILNNVKAIYNYMDYRHFLADYVEDQKEKRSWFSTRYFASKLNMDHSNLVKITLGKRHASKAIVSRIVNVLSLNPRETKYLKGLVAFNKAKTQAESKSAFAELLSVKNMSLRKLKPQQYDYYQKWYHTVIFSLLDYYEFKGDYRALAAQLNPKITAQEAQKSIELLESLGLIYKDKEGKYQHKHQLITSGEKWHSMAIQNFQEETVKLAQNALLNQSTKVREITTLTVTASKEDVEIIRELMSQFRKTVVELISESQSADSVYQVNIQLFPLTKPKWKFK